MSSIPGSVPDRRAGLLRRWSPIYCFGEHHWHQYLLEASKQQGGRLAWPDAAREFAEVIQSCVSGHVKTTVGHDWLGDDSTIEKRWLSADFHYPLVLAEARSSHSVLPAAVEHAGTADESFQTGMVRFRQALLEKSIAAFLECEKRDEVDSVLQFTLGLLRLYGVDEYVNVIDLQQAEQHFINASRFARLHGSSPMWTRLVWESFFHAGIACYAQAGEEMLARHPSSHDLLRKALGHFTRALEMEPALSEAHFQAAKILAELRQTPESIDALRTAILADPNYCLKADPDPAFDAIRERVYSLYDELRTDKAAELAAVIAQVRDVIEGGGCSVLSEAARETSEEAARLCARTVTDQKYFRLLEQFQAACSLRDRLRQLQAEGRIGNEAAARVAAQASLQKAAEGVSLAEQLGVPVDSGRPKLDEIRRTFESKSRGYRDICDEADPIAHSCFETMEAHFRHFLMEETDRFRDLEDEVLFVGRMKEECKGVFGGAGLIGALVGAGVGASIGFFTGFMMLFAAVGTLIALGWFSFREGLLAQIRFSHALTKKQAELKEAEAAVQRYARLVQKCQDQTLTTSDLH